MGLNHDFIRNIFKKNHRYAMTARIYIRLNFVHTLFPDVHKSYLFYFHLNSFGRSSNHRVCIVTLYPIGANY